MRPALAPLYSGRAGRDQTVSALDWWTVKPSSSPPLTQAEILALPAGMVVIEVAKANKASVLPTLVMGGEDQERRIALWRRDLKWSRTIGLWEDSTAEFYLPMLPRLSFALTTEAVRKRQKTVTRRLSRPRWWREGAWFLGVDKIRQAGAQGLCIARCGPPNYEPLGAISQSEVDREGFPNTTPEGFCAMFRNKMPRSWDGWVWRLPFSYLEIPR